MPSPPLIRRLALSMLAIAGQSGWAASDCDTPPESWQPRSAVHALAERNGWQVERLKIDDGCYEIKGLDAEGRPFKAKIDPTTMQVVHIKRGEHGIRDRERERQGERRADPYFEPPKPTSSGVHE